MTSADEAFWHQARSEISRVIFWHHNTFPLSTRQPVKLSNNNNPLSTPLIRLPLRSPRPSACDLGIESLGHVPATEEVAGRLRARAGGDLSASSHAQNSSHILSPSIAFTQRIFLGWQILCCISNIIVQEVTNLHC